MFKIKDRSFYKEILVLALPIAGQFMISQILQLIDNIMVGSLGEASISAVAICTTFTWLIMTFFMGFASGSSVLSAQEYGRKNYQKMKTLTATAIRINLIMMFVFFFVASAFPAQILRLYTNQEDVILKGVEYISIMKYSFFLTSITTVFVSMLQAGRNVKLGFVNTLVSCFVNAGLNYLLIFGKFGFPQLGIQGAALATLIARVCEVCIVVVYVFFIEKEIRFRFKDVFLRLDMSELINLIKVTIPILVIEVLNNLVSSAQTSITGHISKYYVAANSIVHTAWVIPSTLSFGVSMASGVMVGNVIGEGDKDKVQDYAESFVGFSILFGFFNSFMLTVILPIIMSQYNVSTETLDLASKMGKLAVITVFFISISTTVCQGIIKASGQTQKLLVIDLISNWIIAIPLGYVCAFVFKVPVQYIYLILRSGNIFKSIWGILKVRSRTWIPQMS